MAAAEDQQWRVYAAVPYLTICGQPNESRPFVRSFAQQGGLIHLHGIPLNVAEKSNEARTQVVHYSSAESGTHTRWPFYNTVLGDRLETGTHPESQPHGTCAAQSQRAHANGTANKFPIKAVPLRLHTI